MEKRKKGGKKEAADEEEKTQKERANNILEMIRGKPVCKQMVIRAATSGIFLFSFFSFFFFEIISLRTFRHPNNLLVKHLSDLCPCPPEKLLQFFRFGTRARARGLQIPISRVLLLLAYVEES